MGVLSDWAKEADRISSPYNIERHFVSYATKPRLRMRNGMWICGTHHGGSYGTGPSLRAAYDAWQTTLKLTYRRIFPYFA